MSAGFDELLATLSACTEEEMGRPWRWPGHEGPPLEVRDAHWKVFEAESAAMVTAPPPSSEAAAIMDVAQAAFGDLRGLLAGQPDHLLDAQPPDGGWTLRHLLTHVLVVDRRYRRQIEYAVNRTDDQPVYLDRPFDLDPAEETGGVREWLNRLAATRSEFDRFGRGLAAGALVRPSVWARYDVDVRFRLHRTAAHLAEHAIHAQKVLRALGHPPSEAREAARRISVLRGEHEGRTPPEELARLDRSHLALAQSISATP